MVNDDWTYFCKCGYSTQEPSTMMRHPSFFRDYDHGFVYAGKAVAREELV